MTKHDLMTKKFSEFIKIRLNEETNTLQRLMHIFEEIYWCGWFDGEDFQKSKNEKGKVDEL